MDTFTSNRRRWGVVAAIVATSAYASPRPAANADDVTSQTGSAVNLVYPNGLALDGEGNLLISDIGSHSIFRLQRGGRLHLVAGTGRGGFGGDGGPATEATLHAPHDLAFHEGKLLIADTFNHRIRAIDSRGTITTIAGNGTGGYFGDGGPATEAALNNPQSVVVDEDGCLYIADTYNHVVRRVDVNGVIHTFAGSEGGLAGDGGLATDAQLSLPMAVAIGPDGVYICDAGNSRIRRVSPDGVIETVIGCGEGAGLGGAGFRGDGGPARRAKLFSPADLAVGPMGNLFISDSGNCRIRLLHYGIVSTIAGTGEPGLAGDGESAVAAQLHAPQKIVVDASGAIFVADRANRRVRRIGTDGVISTVIAGGTPTDAITVFHQRPATGIPASEVAQP